MIWIWLWIWLWTSRSFVTSAHGREDLLAPRRCHQRAQHLVAKELERRDLLYHRLFLAEKWLVLKLRYGHAVTDTAPGHSALYTGAVPRTSGIIGNEIIRDDGGKATSILDDAATRLVIAGLGGSPGKTGSSLAALVPTRLT